jgi:hypothetical protein
MAVFVGAIWIAAARHADRETMKEHPPRPRASTTATPAEAAANNKDVNPAATALPANGPRVPSLELIGELLDRQRRLGPADRGDEDEIRCTLLSLLTDANAGAIVQALPEDSLRSEFGVTALARWAATDVLAASLWLAQQPAQSGEQTWVIAQALVKDTVVLEAFDEELPAGSWREELLGDASHAALPDNPAGAVRLADRMQPGADRTRALLTVADEWARRDPAVAARWIATEPDSALRDELVFAGAAARASTDPIGALDWTLAITSDTTFDQATGKIATMWADYAPDQAQRFFAPLASRDSSPADDDPGGPP